MKNSVTGTDQLCVEIAKVMGISHCKSITLKMEADSVVTVEALYYPTSDQLKKIVPTLKKFELVRKK